ncbi:hypothetical protein [Craterilacuibacter sp. RT1T]|uniref:hypothetical protein n=1 Tax=Craterilacuibacter sp. RT1T TaxID=2942211 RepID=UPI0020C00F6C|nr:hypothetical protein [Craterilacuibacter sp. RT1T]MCL6263603.1 hypothetical protein [Craterilacuibacter sp. RT1T]
MAQLKTISLAVAAALALAACGGGGGGGGGGGSSGSAAAQDNAVQGVAIKGLLEGAEVYAFKVNADGTVDSKAINDGKPAITNAKGEYSLKLGSYSGALLIKVKAVAGAKMQDELQGAITLAANQAFELDALLEQVGSGSNKANVTPISQLAAAKLLVSGKLADLNGDGKVDATDIKNIDVVNNAIMQALTGNTTDPLQYDFNPSDTSDKATAILQQASLIFNKPETVAGCTDKGLDCALGEQAKALGTLKIADGKITSEGLAYDKLLAIASAAKTAFGDKAATATVPDSITGNVEELQNATTLATQITQSKLLVNSLRNSLLEGEQTLKTRGDEIGPAVEQMADHADVAMALSDAVERYDEAEAEENDAGWDHFGGNGYHCQEQNGSSIYQCWLWVGQAAGETLLENGRYAQFTLKANGDKVEWAFASKDTTAALTGTANYTANGYTLSGKVPVNGVTADLTFSSSYSQTTDTFTGSIKSAKAEVVLSNGQTNWTSEGMPTGLSIALKGSSNGYAFNGSLASSEQIDAPATAATPAFKMDSKLTLKGVLSKAGATWFDGTVVLKADKPYSPDTSAGTLSIIGLLPVDASRTIKLDSALALKADKTASLDVNYTDNGVSASVKVSGKQDALGKLLPESLVATSRNLKVALKADRTGTVYADDKEIGRVSGKVISFKDGSKVSLG